MTDNAGAKGAMPEKIGRYKVIERIGHGAMGLVYRARDEAMGREVAIKLLVTDLEDEPEVRARFAREAESAARLSQPNIITIFDVGEDRGRFYIVMELLRGLTLKEFLDAKEPTLERKVDLMIQLCAGLSAAHSEGIYHRDIKPGNLFVRNDGLLKILDFGVARLSSSNMTSAGLVVGTPDYMSPEQARGLPIDGRSDIFSAGGVFYLMLTGRKPFEARDLPTIFRKIQSEQPRPLTESEGPPELARIIEKMLAKDRTQRYQTCQDLSNDLVDVKRSISIASSGMSAPIPIPNVSIPPPVAVPTTIVPEVAVPASPAPPVVSPTDETPPAGVPIPRVARTGTSVPPQAPPQGTAAPVQPQTPQPPPRIAVSTTDATILMTPASRQAPPPQEPEEMTKWAPSQADSEVTSYPFGDASDAARARLTGPDTDPLRRSAPPTGDSRTRVTQQEQILGPKLVIFRGDSVVREFALTGQTIKLGRGLQNQLVLDDGGVSDVHAEIRPEGAGYTIVDLDSAKGVWFRKQRVQSVGLRLGDSVSVGPFEIAMEDDSGSLEASGVMSSAAPAVPYAPRSAPAPRAEAQKDTAPAPKPKAPAAPAARSKPAARSTKQPLPPLVLWAAAAIVILILGLIAMRFFRAQPEPKQIAPVTAPPVQPKTEASPPPRAPVDTTADQNAQDVAAAREQMARSDFAGAIKDHLQPVLDRDPRNGDALALKAEAETAIAKASAASSAGKSSRKDPAADVKLVAGITRLPNESGKDYSDRAGRIQTRYGQGKQELDQKKFGAAIESFQNVEREQPNYLDVRSLIADASTQRSAAYRDAMDRGGKSEGAGQLLAAYQAYRSAEQFDTTLAASEKAKGVRERMSKDAAPLLERASTFEKMRRPTDAIKLYQQVVDSLPEGDDLRAKALDRLKVLKP